MGLESDFSDKPSQYERLAPPANRLLHKALADCGKKSRYGPGQLVTRL